MGTNVKYEKVRKVIDGQSNGSYYEDTWEMSDQDLYIV